MSVLGSVSASACHFSGVRRATAAADLWHATGAAAELGAIQREGALGAPQTSFRLLGPVGPSCAGGLRSFGTGDDEKRFCLSTVKHRVLWSIGSNNEFGFELAAFEQFEKIYVFDCTLPNNTISAEGAHWRKHYRETADARALRLSNFARLLTKVTFFPVCLSAPTDAILSTQPPLPTTSTRRSVTGDGHGTAATTRRYATYAELLSLTGESRGPDLLKMDIEGWEWAALTSMVRKSAGWPAHMRPQQIAFELHLLDRLSDEYLRAHPGTTRAPGVPFCSRRNYNRGCAKPPADVHTLMRSLYRSGFMLISAQANRGGCAHCKELVVAQVGECARAAVATATPPALASANLTRRSLSTFAAEPSSPSPRSASHTAQAPRNIDIDDASSPSSLASGSIDQLMEPPDPMDVSIDVALRAHLSWQRELLRHARVDAAVASRVRFLVLRPATARFVCAPAAGSSKPKCRSVSYHKLPWNGLPGPHQGDWDSVLVRSAGLRGGSRVLPGLGNIAVALASSAALAVLTRRVLLVENWTIAAEVFAPPLTGLLVGRSGWEGVLDAAHASGARRELFFASDDVDGAIVFCQDADRDVASVPQRVLRLYADQYFLPLTLLSPRHRAQMLAWHARAGGRGLYGALIATLLRPLPHLRARIDARANELSLRSPSRVHSKTLAMHLRCVTLDGVCKRRVVAALAKCAATRLTAANETDLYVATLHQHNLVQLRDELQKRTAIQPAWAAHVARRGPPHVHDARTELAPPARPTVLDELKAAGLDEKAARSIAQIVAPPSPPTRTLALPPSMKATGELARTPEGGGPRDARAVQREEARVVDVWLVSRGGELLLSSTSTMGYLARALALADEPGLQGTHEPPPVFVLRTCLPPPASVTPDPVFHLLEKAIKRSPICIQRAKEMDATTDPKLRALWNATRARW